MRAVIPLEDAQTFVIGACPALNPVELPFRSAEGHVLATDVVATEQVPPFDNSAVDGYAVHAADTVAVPVEPRLHLGADDVRLRGIGGMEMVPCPGGVGQKVEREPERADVPQAGGEAIASLEALEGDALVARLVLAELRPEPIEQVGFDGHVGGQENTRFLQGLAACGQPPRQAAPRQIEDGRRLGIAQPAKQSVEVVDVILGVHSAPRKHPTVGGEHHLGRAVDQQDVKIGAIIDQHHGGRRLHRHLIGVVVGQR